MRILLVEDDRGIVELLTKSFNTHNYSVDSVGDGVRAWEYLSTIEYDLIILDVLLPHLDGVSLCRRLRAEKIGTPILILTAQNHSQAKVRGLDSGADDCLAKPFDLEELMARVRALLRRRGGDLFPVLQCGGLLFNPAQCSVSYDGLPLILSTKEYGLLELFLHNPNHVFSMDEILESLWSSDEYPAEATVRSHIRRLRSRLIEAGAPKDLISNVHGRGYFLKQEDKMPLSERGSEVLDERQLSLQRSITPSVEVQYQYFLDETWQQFHPKAREYVQHLEQVIAQLNGRELSLLDLETAHFMAHRLAGTLGLFNQESAMIAAQSLELTFESLASEVRKFQDADVIPLIFPEVIVPDCDQLNQSLQQIKSVVAVLAQAQGDRAHLSCYVVLNLDDQITQQLLDAASSLPVQITVCDQCADLLPLLTCRSQDLCVQGVILPITITGLTTLSQQNFTWPPQLNCSYPIPILIGVGQVLSFDQRLAAIRLGVDYTLDGLFSAPTVLQQILELTSQPCQPLHILLVDDDQAWLQTMAMGLENLGFEVTILSQATEFLSVLEASQPEVVVLDYKMPQVNGLELCQILRGDLMWQSIPIIVLSDVTDLHIQDQAMQCGADEFLAKQLSVDVIARRILQRLVRMSVVSRLQVRQPLLSI